MTCNTCEATAPSLCRPWRCCPRRFPPGADFHRRLHQNSRVVLPPSFQSRSLLPFLSVRLTFYDLPPSHCPPPSCGSASSLSSSVSQSLPRYRLPSSVSGSQPVCGDRILSVTAAKYANEVANIWLIPYLSPAVKHAVSHSLG